MSEARTTAPRVTVLPATRNRFTTAPIAAVQKRRVAAYARVSTDSDEQLTSYEAQVDYYTHYIKERPDWVFAGMYADEGISGTNTKRRESFNQMIADAAGRENRPHRHQVRLPLCPQHCGQPDHRAQTQGKGRRGLLPEGKHLHAGLQGRAAHHDHVQPCAGREPQHLGKRDMGPEETLRRRQGFHALQALPRLSQGRNGEPEIVPEEAEVVRRIYRLFLEGQTPYGIKRVLEEEHVPTPAGRETWQTATILSILTNEKYKGDALLQKTFCTDSLPRR